jgi:hypothetical protein
VPDDNSVGPHSRRSTHRSPKLPWKASRQRPRTAKHFQIIGDLKIEVPNLAKQWTEQI